MSSLTYFPRCLAALEVTAKLDNDQIRQRTGLARQKASKTTTEGQSDSKARRINVGRLKTGGDHTARKALKLSLRHNFCTLVFSLLASSSTAKQTRKMRKERERERSESEVRTAKDHFFSVQ